MPAPTRQDWLLRFIAGTDGYDGFIDVIRVMKGLFLFQAEKNPPAEVNYAFKPYDYGPFTPEIYRDAEDLARCGLIAASPNDKAYRVTEAGRKKVASLPFDQEAESSLIDLRVQVEDMSFRDLLKWVYSRHQDSAKRSIAKDILRDIGARPRQ